MGPLLVILFTFIIANVSCQLFQSPCPKLFKYEPRTENDRWYGVLTLLSDSELSGVWVRIIFDKPSIQLGNWFGEVVTTDNTEYLIKRRNHKVLANVPQTIRFYLKYNPNETPPQVVLFRLNAKTVCPEGGLTTESPTTTGQLLTSNVIATTVSSFPIPASPEGASSGGGVSSTFGQPTSGPTYTRPGGGFQINNQQNTDDDDFFQGDFAIFKPNDNPIDTTSCGTVVKQPRPLITYGQETHEGEFPWHAALYHARGIDLTYTCGASLISKIHLITVAHCVTRRKTQSTLSPSSLVVYLGKFYLKTWSNPGIQDKHVEKIFVHPKYSPQIFSNDIAILKLSSSVDITDYVRPVCIWEDQTTLDSIVGKLGTVVGWGFDANGKVTEQLTKAQMPVVSQETCIYSFPDFYSRFTSEHTLCAGFKNGTSVCNGDSGGGMVFPKSGSNPNNPIWQLRGLVSISVALQNQFKCDASHYVVFTDTAKYLDWIRNTLAL